MKGWQRLSKIGIYSTTPHTLVRSIVLSNRISIVLFLLTLLLLVVLVTLSGVDTAIVRITGSLLFYATTPFLNYFKKYNGSRFIVSVVVPLYILFLIGANPSNATQLVYTASYFPPRILTIATCIIPFLVFNTLTEKKLLIAAASIGFLCSVGYDMLLWTMGKEVDVYAQPDLFIYYNLIFFLQFATLTASAFMMKRSVDAADETNYRLLIDKEEASHIIEQQRNKLELNNKQLERTVALKSQELIKANEELTKHNIELRQFSFTVSHNLRSPVARLLGLTYLLDGYEKEIPETLREYITLIQKSTNELDDVIKDLNKIIDIRNDIYRIKEKVNLQTEWLKVVSLLKANSEAAAAQLITYFEKAPELFTIRPIIHNAFFNLLSNAIKYRSPQRNLQVSVVSAIEDNSLVVKFSDNGLGIDLERFGQSIFGLYKRFHTHVEGKGIGLYLIKSQLDSLGGCMEVQSEVNKGTTFKLVFPLEAGLQEQVFFQNESVVISYNAVKNHCTMVWKKEVDSKTYRWAYSKAVEMLSIYNTPSWLTDSRALNEMKSEELEWMFSNILVQAHKNGLKNIALVLDRNRFTSDYVRFIEVKSNAIGLKMEIFSTVEEGEVWLTKSTHTL